MLNESIRYVNEALYCDNIPVQEIAAQVGTPVYIYSLRRVLANYERIRAAFAPIGAHLHYSIKANGNLMLLRTLVGAGAGMDAVSGGEVYRALKADTPPEKIVFAGVGKTRADLRYALEAGVGWFNVENVTELALIDRLAAELGRTAQVALRFNPDVQAATHRHIATGHGGAKFGLSAEVITNILEQQSDYKHLRIEGLHLHIGSQLHETSGTEEAIRLARALAEPYPNLRTLDIGGGLPVAYAAGDDVPPIEAFADALAPLLRGYDVLLEPGRAIIADAGILVTEVLYLKSHAGEHFAITDAGMTELIRPALYEAHHEIVPVDARRNADASTYQVVGPVCETTDVLARGVALGDVQPGDLLAILTAGAYGMVMASNYNARPRPAEVCVMPDGATWQVARQRETWDDLLRGE
jgi:diaminopimelate decarboxylase